MFNHVHVNINSVEFEYVTKGNLENISIARPDGVGYSQWSSVWDGFVEFIESRQPTLYDYVERQIDASEIESLEDQISELQEEVESLESDISALEIEIEELEAEVFRLNGEE